MRVETNKTIDTGRAKNNSASVEDIIGKTTHAHHIEDALSAENVHFTYDANTFVLKGIDLDIKQGEFVCILGGNGSGKSTLAKHINALLLPDEGTVLTLGNNTQDTNLTYSIRSSAGMVFQNPDDQIVASLVENDVAFGPENLGIPNPELRERVTRALKEVGLCGFETCETNLLSGGQKQRVAIAGVLAMQPKILILDEASAMLDPRGRRALINICKKLNECGLTIIMITHFMEEAAQASRVIVLEDGCVRIDASPHKVLQQAELLESLNLEVPESYSISRALAKAGIPINYCISEKELEEELCQLFLNK